MEQMSMELRVRDEEMGYNGENDVRRIIIG
jgi:hypothetical protein